MTLTVNYDKVKSQNQTRYKNSPFFLFFVKDNEKSLGIFTPCQGANIPKDFLLSLLNVYYFLFLEKDKEDKEDPGDSKNLQ